MTRLGSFRLPLLALLPALAFAATSPLASAQETSVKLRDSFPIGSGEGTLCQVQDRSYENAAKQSIFDRSWTVVAAILVARSAISLPFNHPKPMCWHLSHSTARHRLPAARMSRTKVWAGLTGMFAS